MLLQALRVSVCSESHGGVDVLTYGSLVENARITVNLRFIGMRVS